MVDSRRCVPAHHAIHHLRFIPHSPMRMRQHKKKINERNNRSIDVVHTRSPSCAVRRGIRWWRISLFTRIKSHHIQHFDENDLYCTSCLLKRSCRYYVQSKKEKEEKVWAFFFFCCLLSRLFFRSTWKIGFSFVSPVLPSVRPSKDSIDTQFLGPSLKITENPLSKERERNAREPRKL